MKKYLSTIFSLLLVSTCLVVQAQERQRFEVGVSGGGPGWMLGMVGGAKSTFSLLGEIKYTPIKWVSLGLLGGVHDRQPGDYYALGEDASKSEIRYCYNLMLMAYGNWFTRERVNIYSGIGYGTIGGYVDGDGRPSHGFQITPIGISYGKRLFVFAELGMGWGFWPARAGIGFRF